MQLRATDNEKNSEPVFAPRFQYSLFIKFFAALITLALIPTGLIILFTVATYQRLFANYIAQDEAIALFAKNGILQAEFIFLFITILSIFVAFILSRNITRSLRTLTEGVDQVARGDLNVSFRVTRKDEIGALATFFNVMIGKFREVHDRQETISRMKSEFVSTAAHQLRTPLSGMKWALHMTLAGDLGKISKEAKDTLEKTYEANERMITLVNDLLNVARIEEGRFGYSFQEVGIGPFLKALINDYALPAKRKNIHMQLLLPSEPYTAFLDPDRMHLALSNIIGNAIAYTPEGKNITVMLTKSDQSFLQVSIKDEGLGIASQDQDRIFSKFFRGENVVKKETEGSGLGLFITKNIIEQHGGNIWFESAIGQGTEFFLTLPRHKELVKVQEFATRKEEK